MSQRCEFLAGNFLNNQSVPIALTSQTRDRHSPHRKRDLHGISKAQRGVGSDCGPVLISHRAFREFDRAKIFRWMGLIGASAILTNADLEMNLITVRIVKSAAFECDLGGRR
jgi:hypothetical protein